MVVEASVEAGAIVSVVGAAVSVVAGAVVSVVDSVAFSSLQDANAAIANTIKSFFMFSVLDFV